MNRFENPIKSLMNKLITHQGNEDTYAVFEDVQVLHGGDSFPAVPYQSLNKNKETLYFRLHDDFDKFDITGLASKAVLESLPKPTIFKIKLNGQWVEIEEKSIKK